MPRVERPKRSLKQIIKDYSIELLGRCDTDAKAAVKLEAIEQIAQRMGWMELFNKIRYRNANRPQPWWVK